MLAMKLIKPVGCVQIYDPALWLEMSKHFADYANSTQQKHTENHRNVFILQPQILEKGEGVVLARPCKWVGHVLVQGHAFRSKVVNLKTYARRHAPLMLTPCPCPCSRPKEKLLRKQWLELQANLQETSWNTRQRFTSIKSSVTMFSKGYITRICNKDMPFRHFL